MKTISNKKMNEIIIKNSRFICYLIPIEQDNVDDIINEIRYEHLKATHVCYAYIFDEVKHSSDDGEPSGTAGLPILNVLEKEELNYVLAVVVRYFGGIKLGAGGLVRAYTKSVTETLKNVTYVKLIPGYKISITFAYENEKDVLYIVGENSVLDKKYLENITYICYVDIDTLEKLSRYSPDVLEKCNIKELN